MFFSNLFGSSKKNSRPQQSTTKCLGFECLEDRTMLSINLGEHEIIVEYSPTGIPEGPPMATYTGPGSVPLATVDEGDFYYYFMNKSRSTVLPSRCSSESIP